MCGIILQFRFPLNWLCLAGMDHAYSMYCRQTIVTDISTDTWSIHVYVVRVAAEYWSIHG